MRTCPVEQLRARAHRRFVHAPATAEHLAALPAVLPVSDVTSCVDLVRDAHAAERQYPAPRRDHAMIVRSPANLRRGRVHRHGAIRVHDDRARRGRAATARVHEWAAMPSPWKHRGVPLGPRGVPLLGPAALAAPPARSGRANRLLYWNFGCVRLASRFRLRRRKSSGFIRIVRRALDQRLARQRVVVRVFGATERRVLVAIRHHRDRLLPQVVDLVHDSRPAESGHRRHRVRPRRQCSCSRRRRSCPRA